MNPRRQRVKWRIARNRNWRRQADAFVALGLTTRGTPRVYRQRPELAGVHGRRRKTLRQKLVRAERRRRGFTARGNRIKHFSPVTNAYLEFRATIPMPELNFTTGRCE